MHIQKSKEYLDNRKRLKHFSQLSLIKKARKTSITQTKEKGVQGEDGLFLKFKKQKGTITAHV